MNAPVNGFVGLLAVALFVVVYLLPIQVAYLRQHRHLGSIVVITVLLGWTFIGWTVALAWAFSDSPPTHARTDWT